LQGERTEKGKDKADKVIRFIETLVVPSGIGAGAPFKLDDWQKAFIRDIYEPQRVLDGGRELRVVRRAILSMGRKNGKTALIATLALAHLGRTGRRGAWRNLFGGERSRPGLDHLQVRQADRRARSRAAADD
jgi:phage terminase large subunit-like protein